MAGNKYVPDYERFGEGTAIWACGVAAPSMSNGAELTVRYGLASAAVLGSNALSYTREGRVTCSCSK